MQAQLDQFARFVLENSGSLHLEVDPAEFGPSGGRLTAFKERLQAVVEQHPDIRISISGTSRDLRSLELAAGAAIFLVNHMCPVSLGDARETGKVRVTFTRASSA